MYNIDFKDSKVVKKKLSELKLAEYNPRTISKEAFKGLGASIEKFGMMVPIIWNKRTGNIVGGHQRYKYLMERGETETEVVEVDLDGNEEVALNITLNNQYIRGRFTNDVIQVLKMCEDRLGNVFEEIKLDKLLKKMELGEEKIKSIKERENEEQPEEQVEEKEEKSSKDFEAIITCPECQSKWKLKDNTIVLDTTKENEDEQDK